MRSDALPEGMQYHDNGCEAAPKCVECPLPKCRYEYPGGLRGLRNLERNAHIRELRATMTYALIAATVGISKRTVFRVLAA